MNQGYRRCTPKMNKMMKKTLRFEILRIEVVVVITRSNQKNWINKTSKKPKKQASRVNYWYQFTTKAINIFLLPG